MQCFCADFLVHLIYNILWTTFVHKTQKCFKMSNYSVNLSCLVHSFLTLNLYNKKVKGTILDVNLCMI
jgi:hypothetical protein